MTYIATVDSQFPCLVKCWSSVQFHIPFSGTDSLYIISNGPHSGSHNKSTAKHDGEKLMCMVPVS